MNVTVITPETSLYEGPADAVVATAYDGRVGILPRHAPFMTLLGAGSLIVRHLDQTHEFDVQGGFLQVVGDVVRVVTEQVTVEPPAATS